MWYEEPVTSPEYAIEMARYISVLRGPPTAAAIFQTLRDSGVNIVRSIFIPSTTLNLSHAYATDGVRGFLAYDGTTTTEQTLAQVKGFGDFSLGDNANPVSPIYELNATQSIDSLFSGAYPLPQTMHVCGWSAGGAAAQLSLIRLGLKGMDPENLRCTSFGSTRVGGPSTCARLDKFRQNIRWFSSNDPVPLLPPDIREFPPISLLLGPAGAVRAHAFRHCAEGIQINPDLTLEDRMLPEQALTNLGLSLVAWLTAQQDSDNAHSIFQYVLALRGAIAFGTSREIAPPSHQAEKITPVTIREVNRISQFVINQVHEQRSATNNVPHDQPESTIFRARNIGGIWQVYYGDQPVFLAKGKRDAKHLSKRSNAFFRSLNVATMADTVGLVAAVEHFVAIAQSSGSPIQPPIRTTF